MVFVASRERERGGARGRIEDMISLLFFFFRLNQFENFIVSFNESLEEIVPNEFGSGIFLLMFWFFFCPTNNTNIQDGKIPQFWKYGKSTVSKVRVISKMHFGRCRRIDFERRNYICNSCCDLRGELSKVENLLSCLRSLLTK